MTTPPKRARPIVVTILFVAVAALLAIPGTAGAANVTCGGHLERGTAEDTGDHALTYEFGCSDTIIGYSLVFDQLIAGFEPEVGVLDDKGEATSELMSCEGAIPSYGIGCFGAYSAGGRDVRGTVQLDRDACADPRYQGWLTVIVGVKGQSAGPFLLRNVNNCARHTSRLSRLLAWVELVRKELLARNRH